MKRQRVYKIVREDLYSHKLYSLVASINVRVEYRVGEWISGGYPLFAYTSLEEAREYAIRGDSIYECVAEDVTPQKYCVWIYRLINQNLIDEFWNGNVAHWKKMKKRGDVMMFDSDGVVSVERIMLLREVQ